MTTTTYAIRYTVTRQLAAVVDAQDERAALEAHWDDVRAAEEHRNPGAFRVDEVRRMTVRAWIASGCKLNIDEVAALDFSGELRLAIDAGVLLLDEDGEPLETLETCGGARAFYAALDAIVAEMEEA